MSGSFRYEPLLSQDLEANKQLEKMIKQRIAFALIMGIITTGIISFTLISINFGFGSNFVAIWLRSWSMAYVIVIPVILIVGPMVQNVVNNVFKEKAPLNIEQ